MTTKMPVQPQTPAPEKTEPTTNDSTPVWQQKKNSRQKILRAIRAKSFSETVRVVIRAEMKKTEDGEAA